MKSRISVFSDGKQLKKLTCPITNNKDYNEARM